MVFTYIYIRVCAKALQSCPTQFCFYELPKNCPCPECLNFGFMDKELCSHNSWACQERKGRSDCGWWCGLGKGWEHLFLCEEREGERKTNKARSQPFTPNSHQQLCATSLSKVRQTPHRITFFPLRSSMTCPCFSCIVLNPLEGHGDLARDSASPFQVLLRKWRKTLKGQKMLLERFLLVPISQAIFIHYFGMHWGWGNTLENY